MYIRIAQMTFFRNKIADSFGIGQNAAKRSVINDTTLHRLISEQDWDAAERLLDRATKKSRNSARHVVKDKLILHFACQFDPPLQIVTKLFRVIPSSHAVDSRSRYPLHIAVASGCDPDVIKFLIQTNPAAAGAQDQSGRTPMHYAGKSFADNYAHFHFDSPIDHVDEVCHIALLVVELLAKTAIQTVNVEDKEGMNPIEYALLSTTNLKVIRLMQRASRRDWKKRTVMESGSDASTLQGRLSRPPPIEKRQSLEDLFKDMYDNNAVNVDIDPIFTQRHKRGTVAASEN